MKTRTTKSIDIVIAKRAAADKEAERLKAKHAELVRHESIERTPDASDKMFCRWAAYRVNASDMPEQIGEAGPCSFEYAVKTAIDTLPLVEWVEPA